MFHLIQQDYQTIRQQIVTHQVSQKGQKMLLTPYKSIT